MLGNNMFAYCNNNPVIYRDSSGHAVETVLDLISLGASVAEVMVNPTDPWAWLSLLGDGIDVAVPFVGGLGEAVRVIKVAAKTSDIADDVIDISKITQNTLEVIKDSAKTLAKGNNTVYVSYVDDVVEYVGITNDFSRRQREWAGVRNIVEFVPNVDRTGARCIEQTVITLLGMNKGGGLLSNAINSIGVNGSKYSDYLEYFVGLLE